MSLFVGQRRKLWRLDFCAVVHEEGGEAGATIVEWFPMLLPPKEVDDGK
jgi:hypothetical protein